MTIHVELHTIISLSFIDFVLDNFTNLFRFAGVQLQEVEVRCIHRLIQGALFYEKMLKHNSDDWCQIIYLFYNIIDGLQFRGQHFWD